MKEIAPLTPSPKGNWFQKQRSQKGMGGIIFDVFNYSFMVVLAFSILYPFWNLFLLSFSESKTATTLGFRIWLNSWHLDSYRFALKMGNFLVAYRNTIFRTVVGTVLLLIMCFLGAYPLSKKNLPGRNLITIYFLIPFFFSGGLIPTYFLIRSLGLINKIWVLIIPSMFSIYSMIIMRNFLMAMEKELEEAAFIDGANYLQIAWYITLPLMKPVIAVVALWNAVWHWNSWFDAMIYTTSDRILVLQLLIRRILMMTEARRLELGFFGGAVLVHPATVTAATIIMTIGPIVLVYPFLQKYFVKGIMLGSLKG